MEKKTEARFSKRVLGLFLCAAMVFGYTAAAAPQRRAEASENTQGETRALESDIKNMGLGGYVGENLTGNIKNWQTNAYKDNPNIVEQIAQSKDGKLNLDTLLGTDYFGVDNYFDIDVEENDDVLNGGCFDALLSYLPRKAGAYFGDAGYRLDRTACPGVTDWTGAEEIWLYIDAREYGAENVKIRLNFEEGDFDDSVNPTGVNEAYTLTRGSKVKLLSASGEDSEAEVVLDGVHNDNFIVLDKNFHGFVRMDLSLEQFWRYFNSADGANGILDLKDVHQLTIAVGGADENAVATPLYFAFGVVGTFEDGAPLPVGEIEGKRFKNVLPFSLDLFIPDLTNGVWTGDLYADWDVLMARGRKGYAGNSLRWTLERTNSEYSDRDIRFGNDTNAVTDWTGAKELWAYVDASEVKADAEVRFAFEENGVGRASYRLKQGAEIKLQKNGEDLSRMRKVSAGAGGYVTLPRGFAGFVRMPLDEETFEKYWGENDNNVLDLNKVVQFQLSVKGSDAMVGNSVYMDSFAVAGTVDGTSFPVQTDLGEENTYREIWNLEGLQPRNGYDGGVMIWYGEFAGKLLTGMAFGYKATQDAELKTAGDELVADLAAAQGADGYLGTYSGGARFSIDANNWDLWNHYHCIVGLLEWYEITGTQTAFRTAKKALDCVYETFKDRSYLVGGGFETNRGIAHGYAMMYQATGEQKYLDEAERIIQQDCQDANGWYKKALGGGHFYQSSSARWEVLHMIMTLGILYEETGNREYYEVMESVWYSILQTDIHNTGGFTTNEGACGDPYRTGVIETCCTVAWMAFTNEYYKYSKTVEAADELERSYLNGMLGSLLEDDKYVSYNTPMNGVVGTAGGYDGRRVPSQQDIAFQYNGGSPDFNCCQANLARGLGQIVEWAAMTDEDELYLNYYGESAIQTKVAGAAVTLKQTTQYPLNGNIRLEIQGLEKNTSFALKLRIPAWAQGSRVALNGESLYGVRAGEYFEIQKEWKNGDVVTLELAVSFRYWTGEDTLTGCAAVYYGPVLLALDQSFAPGYTQNTRFTTQQLESAVITEGTYTDTMLNFTVKLGSETVRLVDFASAGKYNGGSVPSTYWSWLKVPDAPKAIEFEKGGRAVWQNTARREVSFGEHIRFENAMYLPGETVSFAVEVPDGKQVDKILVSGVEAVEEKDGSYAFVMPAAEVRVEVTLKDGQQTDSSGGSEGESSSSGCGSIVSGAVGVTALAIAAAVLGKKRKK